MRPRSRSTCRGGGVPSQTWRTFLANHVDQIMAADLFVVPTATYRLLFVLVILAHERRRVVHVAVTEHPTPAWTVQQLREAFAWDRAPRYLIRDRDHAFEGWPESAKTMGIEEVLTAPHSPPGKKPSCLRGHSALLGASCRPDLTARKALGAAWSAIIDGTAVGSATSEGSIGAKTAVVERRVASRYC